MGVYDKEGRLAHLAAEVGFTVWAVADESEGGRPAGGFAMGGLASSFGGHDGSVGARGFEVVVDA